MARRYRLTRDGSRSTEQLVEAGGYGYAHSCVTSENLPVRALPGGPRVREIVLLGVEGDVTAAEALAEAARRRLERRGIIKKIEKADHAMTTPHAEAVAALIAEPADGSA